MKIKDIQNIQPILTAINLVGNRYAKKSNESSGIDSIIAGEICDAFRELSDEISEQITGAMKDED